mmetsp:Transcript_15454/g.20759  ORF Transcript_15454/g.20759 Transcript_15454/m.20759 type:complete len:84 (+) Transcript_15454:976-1227(+)
MSNSDNSEPPAIMEGESVAGVNMMSFTTRSDLLFDNEWSLKRMDPKAFTRKNLFLFISRVLYPGKCTISHSIVAADVYGTTWT